MSDEQLVPVVDDRDRRGRWMMLRDLAVFQAKLFADGLKDLVLAPISLAAAVLDVIGGGDPGRKFYEVLRWGRGFDRWINLFGAVDPPPADGHELAPKNVDAYVARLELALTEQRRRGRLTARAADAVDRALDALEGLGRGNSDDPPGGA